jgi:hypothetical protein
MEMINERNLYVEKEHANPEVITKVQILPPLAMEAILEII